MGWDISADLEHDLGARPEPQGARVAAAAEPVHVDGHGTPERDEPPRTEWLAPDTEEAIERLFPLVVDDAGGIEGPHTGTAICRDDAAEAATRAPEPDGRRDDDDPPPREQLDVNSRPRVQRCRTAGEACGPRGRWRPVARPLSDRRRHEPGHRSRRAERESAHVHRRQATRIVLCLFGCAILAGCLAASSAKADGDPASDYLVSQQVFLSYDAKIPSALERKLLAAVASANKRGYPIRVALIWSGYDLGSVPELFGKPRKYVRFLDAEDSQCWWGGSCGSGRFTTTTRLLVVMPNGLGFAQWKHDPAGGYRTIAGIKVTRTPAGLAHAATAAVVKLAAAAGVKVSTAGGPAALPRASSGGDNRVEIIVAVVVALSLGAAARLLIRRRATRSAVR